MSTVNENPEDGNLTAETEKTKYTSLETVFPVSFSLGLIYIYTVTQYALEYFFMVQVSGVTIFYLSQSNIPITESDSCISITNL